MEKRTKELIGIALGAIVLGLMLCMLTAGPPVTSTPTPGPTGYWYDSPALTVTPVTELVARAFARRNQPRPVHTYELQLPAPKMEIEQSPDWEDEEDGFDVF